MSEEFTVVAPKKAGTVFHANNCYIIMTSSEDPFGHSIMGRVTNFDLRLNNAREYDTWIGRRGMPSGNPMNKAMRFTGSFSKGLMTYNDGISSHDEMLLKAAIGTNLKRSAIDTATLNLFHNNADASITIEVWLRTQDGANSQYRRMLSLDGVLVNDLNIPVNRASFVMNNISFTFKDLLHVSSRES